MQALNRAPRIIDNCSDAFHVQATWDIGGPRDVEIEAGPEIAERVTPRQTVV